MKPRLRGPFTVSYGEILTAERLPSVRGLRLHTRSSDLLRIPCRGRRRVEMEDELRRRGVRVVDCWGAIVAPTLADFEACDNRLTVPEANREAGDPKLIALFDKYGGRLVSPGGAAGLLGLSRQTIHTLCKRGELRAFRSDEEGRGGLPHWVYIPLDDIYEYGDKVGRSVRGRNRKRARG